VQPLVTTRGRACRWRDSGARRRRTASRRSSASSARRSPTPDAPRRHRGRGAPAPSASSAFSIPARAADAPSSPAVVPLRRRLRPASALPLRSDSGSGGPRRMTPHRSEALLRLALRGGAGPRLHRRPELRRSATARTSRRSSTLARRRRPVGSWPPDRRRRRSSSTAEATLERTDVYGRALFITREGTTKRGLYGGYSIREEGSVPRARCAAASSSRAPRQGLLGSCLSRSMR
jgi:hypothetical protein